MADEKHGPKGTSTPQTVTLRDDEIEVSRESGGEGGKPEVSRRSMLSVLGRVAGAGAAATVLGGCFRRGYMVGAPGARVRTGITDSDGGPYADPAGFGRGSARGAYTGVTDSDGGPYADPAGHGRGRYGYSTGVTDSDGGPYADPAGNGRGTARVGVTGVTDSDGGPYADPAGRGRGRWR